MSTGTLIMNIAVYCVMFIWVLRKRRYVDAFIWLIYLSLSAFALLLYLNPLYPSSSNLKLFPFIYLFVVILFTYFPISKFDFNKEIVPPDQKSLNTFLWVIAIVTIVNLPVVLGNFISNFHRILHDNTFLLQQYQESRQSYSSGLENGGINYFSVISNIIGEVTTFFLMYYLTLGKRKKFFTVVLILSVLIQPINFLLSSQRGGLTSFLLMIIVTYLFFKNLYSEKINVLIKRILFLLIAFSFVGIFTITASRFMAGGTDDYSLLTFPVLLYVGQAMLNFDFYALDPGGLRYGDRAIPLFKMIFFPETAYTYDSRMEKYSYLKIQEDTFSTYVGDIAIDFGPVVTLALIILMSCIIYRLSYVSSKSTTMPFYRIVPVYALVHFMVTGWTLNRFGNVGGNLVILLYILIYFFFKYKIKL